jgi:hypothetical protein
MKVTYPRLWLKHWRVRQALVNYPLYDVPHKTRERDLPEAQVRENFAYFMRVRHKRLADFQSWLHGNFRYDASLDAAGAEQLSRWIDEYGGGVIDDEPGSMSIFESYSPTWVDRYAGYNTMIDLGIFMGEFIILKRPKLFWEIYQGHEIEPAISARSSGGCRADGKRMFLLWVTVRSQTAMKPARSGITGSATVQLGLFPTLNRHCMRHVYLTELILWS